MYILYICTLILFSSCTMSVTMVHTEGSATDVVDETQAPKNDISPTVDVSGIPGM